MSLKIIKTVLTRVVRRVLNKKTKNLVNNVENYYNLAACITTLSELALKRHLIRYVNYMLFKQSWLICAILSGSYIIYIKNDSHLIDGSIS